MSAINIRMPELNSDDEGSNIGVDMLMNQRKVNQTNTMDSGSVNSFDIGGDVSPRVIDLGRGGKITDDDISDIEVVSTKSNRNAGGYFTKPQKQAFSDVSSESGGWRQPRTQISNEEILNMKRELLYQFSRLEKRGVNVPKKFNMSSSLEEMKVEYERLKRDKEVEASVRFQRRMLMACVTGVEFLNTKFDPFDIKLDGWSGEISENVNDYDDIFEELYDKYKGKAKIAPELKLLFMVGGSAVWFHISNSMFKTSMPGLDQVLKQNPELRRQFAEATMNTMQQQNPSSGAGAFSGLMGMFGGFGGGGGSPQMQEMPKHQMRGPTNVDDLLNELKEERFNNQNDTFEVISNISGSEFTADVADDVSINGMLKSRKRTSKRRTLDI